ncbi:TRAP transporter small permease [Mesorhizobium sp. CAU 1732]|uniref:TRAP transporter small permease n=1 Tax=Mesorhizobium sp. CAU 1732 TaxID=3140358 RepID=UPI00325FEA7A
MLGDHAEYRVITRALALSLTALRRVVDAAAIFLLGAMTVLVLSQVLGRYVFNYAISWSEESATFAQVWLVMLGAGIAMRNRQHVGIDVVISRCPVALQRIVKAGGFALAAWFLVVVIIGSMSMLTIGMMVKSPALQLPLAIPYMALPIGMAYFLLELAIATLPEVFDPNRAPGATAGDFQ